MQLSQVTTLTAGHPFRGKIPDAPGAGLRAVQIKDLSPTGNIHWEGCQRTHITGRKAPDLLRVGDVLVAARGSRLVAACVDDGATANGLSAVASQYLYVLRLTTNTLLAEFLAWQLNQPPSQTHFQRFSEGSAIKAIRRSLLAATPIAVPPLQTQRRVLALAKTLHRENTVLQQIQQSNARIMHGIATDLLTAEAQT